MERIVFVELGSMEYTAGSLADSGESDDQRSPPERWSNANRNEDNPRNSNPIQTNHPRRKWGRLHESNSSILPRNAWPLWYPTSGNVARPSSMYSLGAREDPISQTSHSLRTVVTASAITENHPGIHHRSAFLQRDDWQCSYSSTTPGHVLHGAVHQYRKVVFLRGECEIYNSIFFLYVFDVLNWLVVL